MKPIQPRCVAGQHRMGVFACPRPALGQPVEVIYHAKGLGL
jgi:hypothetical protein